MAGPRPRNRGTFGDRSARGCGQRPAAALSKADAFLIPANSPALTPSCFCRHDQAHPDMRTASALFVRAFSLAFVSVLELLSGRDVCAVDTEDTCLAAEPAISNHQIAFVYANDIWVAARDGSAPRRLTSHPGVETGPHFSPDGTLITFTGRYEGNTDVYIVPAAG